MVALQISLSHHYQSWSPATQVTPSDPSRGPAALRRVDFGPSSRPSGAVAGRVRERVGERVRVRSQAGPGLEAVLSEPETLAGKVTEVNKDTFWPIVNAAGDKPVVLDMYTQWCGPCKVMAPKFQELAEKYLDVVFLKLDCNDENRPLAKELKIRVVPTFKVLKGGAVVEEVTGAKLDKLIGVIEAARSSSSS